MNEALSFLYEHRSRGALIDANLLLVYIVGKTLPSRLRDFHHTKQYAEDFPLVERVVEFFPVVYTTPNVLTEVGNLGKKLGAEFFDQLGRIISVLEERYCASKEAVTVGKFRVLGLTDAGLYAVAAEHLIVTADFQLYQILRANNLDAVNFHHLRQLAWGS